jgi:hypothetical protein
VLKKKKKKEKTLAEHRTHANRRLKPHPQKSSTGGGMREYNRSATSKKGIRSKINETNKTQNR